ncbi:TetR family transcriptional regulator [Ligilactobacillus pobuzihii E100301 = KCTC 13174]|uniref:TetR family transcriptional regulator n=2 Tax=Ligilactobacillus pobuzihii TaxID=449659 RepID=A0A0R2L5K1_9LACO|nr:TetR family transcriptional regulator [Ligilactobacillus pobuzihii E100301 = KCTC 13174]KRN96785.1 TetR family transcriptional regulator [Ligilactobacillus pobuzihii]
MEVKSMVLPTFENLKPDKQNRIRNSLLNEFSNYPLAEAQVARIVSNAGISRGAFYKYFEDLTDAYNYIFDIAMFQIHQEMPKTPNASNVDEYVESIRHFVSGTDKKGYKDLIEKHYRYNEGFLGSEPTKLRLSDDSYSTWAVTVLYHQTVRDIVLDPVNIEQRIEQLRKVLRKAY